MRVYVYVCVRMCVCKPWPHLDQRREQRRSGLIAIRVAVEEAQHQRGRRRHQRIADDVSVVRKDLVGHQLAEALEAGK